MSFLSRCATVCDDRLIVVEQNGKRFCLKNPAQEKHLLIEVDGCAIVSGERCDEMLHLSSGREIYVELKGADIKKALSQISSTVHKMTRVGDRADRIGVVVSSRVPKEDSATQNAKFKLLRLLASVKIKNLNLSAAENELFS